MQLDLFNRRVGPASVSVFPLACRKGLIEATARALASMEYDDGESFWKSHAAKVRKELKTAGLSPAVIAEELDRYSLAVGRQARIFEEYRILEFEKAKAENSRNALTGGEADGRGPGILIPGRGSRGRSPCVTSNVTAFPKGAST